MIAADKAEAAVTAENACSPTSCA